MNVFKASHKSYDSSFEDALGIIAANTEEEASAVLRQESESSQGTMSERLAELAEIELIPDLAYGGTQPKLLCYMECVE